jgi:hypothetical protein
VGYEMHKDDINIEKEQVSTDTSHKRRRIYYFGSMLFIIGISLIIIASAMVLFFNIHSESDREIIFQIISFFGVGLTVTLTGINLMGKQKIKGYIITALSAFISSIAILLFMLNFLNNWYYPLISYIFILYIIGALVLIGNVFGNVILLIIDRRPEFFTGEMKTSHIYTDEEIMKDIEEATKKSLEAAAADLQFELQDTGNIKLGKSSSQNRGIVTRIKDDINESTNLQKTMSPDVKEEWGSIGIEKASRVLNKTLTEKKPKNKLIKFFKKKDSKESKPKNKAKK